MTARVIAGDFQFQDMGTDLSLEIDSAVTLNTTIGESVGYVMVEVQSTWADIAYLSPSRARELAFSLMDLADLAEMDTGKPPTLDPFEQRDIEDILLAEQASLTHDQ